MASAVCLDARGADAGLTVDVGLPPMDGGEAPDAGAAGGRWCGLALETWFTNYNEGQGQSYLEAQAFAHPEGDPDFEGLPPHRYLQGAAYGPYSRSHGCVVASLRGADADRCVHPRGWFCRWLTPRYSREQLGAACSTPASPWRRSATGGPIGTQHLPCVQSDRTTSELRTKTALESTTSYVTAFLRHRAGDWNLNPERVGAWGSSAGAPCGYGSRPGAARSC